MWSSLGFVALATLATLPSSIAVTPKSQGRQGYGFVGYGIRMSYPVCATACRRTVAAPLNCTGADISPSDYKAKTTLESGDGWVVTTAPSPGCYVHNPWFLQSVAQCISERCRGVPIGDLETYWQNDIPGRKVGQPSPDYTYSVSLHYAQENHHMPLNNSRLLNYVGIVSDKQFEPQVNGRFNFENVEILHSRYGLAILISGLLLPIAFSLLRFLPWPTAWVSMFNAYFIDPSLYGSRHSEPVSFFFMPTRGQALFILYFWAVNIIFSGVGIAAPWPDSSFDKSGVAFRVITFVGNRTGVLSFANLPLVILYASRNNIVLWLTDWSPATFQLVHRWLAFICMLQAVVHSVLYLVKYTIYDTLDHDSEARLPYWYWGVIATLGLVIMIFASLEPIRRRAYRIFISSHIILGIISLIGCYLHILYRYERQWGYETWIYIATGIWVFDRVARIWRIIATGLRRAHVTAIDDEYYAVHIPGVEASGFVYLHFPTLSTWRFWESNPFSVAGLTRGLGHTLGDHNTVRNGTKELSASGMLSSSGSDDSSSGDTPGESNQEKSGSVGCTFLIRQQEGITKRLAGQAQSSSGVPVFVEGSYNTRVTCIKQEAIPSREFPNIIFVAGGVGITPILGLMQQANNIGPRLGTNKLFWGIRSPALLLAVEGMLGHVSKGESNTPRQWGQTDVVVSVGKRLDLGSLLRDEVSVLREGLTVVVCGPAGMADDVRCAAGEIGRAGKIAIRYVEESFQY